MSNYQYDPCGHREERTARIQRDMQRAVREGEDLSGRPSPLSEDACQRQEYKRVPLSWRFTNTVINDLGAQTAKACGVTNVDHDRGMVLHPVGPGGEQTCHMWTVDRERVTVKTVRGDISAVLEPGPDPEWPEDRL